MPRFIIERNIPGLGDFTPEQLAQVSRKSCGVLASLGPEIQWVLSYVTDDKMTCVYIAPNAELVREHARRGGFPADRVNEVRSVVDPLSAEGAFWAYAPVGAATR